MKHYLVKEYTLSLKGVIYSNGVGQFCFFSDTHTDCSYYDCQICTSKYRTIYLNLCQKIQGHGYTVER